MRENTKSWKYENVLGYLKSISRVLTVDGVGGGISVTTNPI